MREFEKKNVPHDIVDSVLEIPCEMSKTEVASPKMRQFVKLENLMIRTYLDNPSIRYSDCRKAVQQFMPEFHLEDADIRERASRLRLSDGAVRGNLANWAKEVAKLVYEGMAGDSEAIKTAIAMVERKYSSDAVRKHGCQEQFVLCAMFRYIPELTSGAAGESLLKLGQKYSSVCLNKILNSIAYDVSEDGLNDLDSSADISELRRKVHLARKELQEYRALVEAADAEFEDKLEELKSQEIAAFFSALNNEKYGFLIDSLYLHKKAFADVKRSGEGLPYAIEGVPAFMDRLMMFLRDAGISPVSKFAPHTTHSLTLEQMEGCRFEPSPERTAPIMAGEVVTVKVISSGWKLGDAIVSYPVLQEE